MKPLIHLLHTLVQHQPGKQQHQVSRLLFGQRIVHHLVEQRQHLQQYSDIMLALFRQMMDDALSEQQAGNLMLLLTGLMLDEGV